MGRSVSPVIPEGVGRWGKFLVDLSRIIKLPHGVAQPCENGESLKGIGTAPTTNAFFSAWYTLEIRGTKSLTFNLILRMEFHCRALWGTPALVKFTELGNCGGKCRKKFLSPNCHLGRLASLVLYHSGWVASSRAKGQPLEKWPNNSLNELSLHLTASLIQWTEPETKTQSLLRTRSGLSCPYLE